MHFTTVQKKKKKEKKKIEKAKEPRRLEGT